MGPHYIYYYMIKLIDLLKELNLDELKFHSGQLDISNDRTYVTFLEDFNIPRDEFFTVGRGKFNSEVFTLKDDAQFNPDLIKKSIIAKDGAYQLIAPPTYTGMLYIINTDGQTLYDYVVGNIDVDIVNLNIKEGKPFKITGVKVNLIYITTPWRGKGLGIKIYTMLLQAYGSVFSDNALYEGSSSIWTKKLSVIGQEPGNFFGVQISNKIIPLTVEDANNRAFIENASVDNFIVSVKPPQALLDIKKDLVDLPLNDRYKK